VPIYDYQCKKCAHRFEKIQQFSDPEIRECPKCGGEVEKLITAPAVQFKGSGWYATDYAKKPSSGGSDATSSSEGSKAEKTGGSDSSESSTSKPKPEPKPAKSES
jgi:putative FmdB family regulatory protein